MEEVKLPQAPFMERFYAAAKERGMSKRTLWWVLSGLSVLVLSLFSVPILLLWALLNPVRHSLLLIITSFVMIPVIIAAILAKTRFLKGDEGFPRRLLSGDPSVFGWLLFATFIPILLVTVGWFAFWYQVSGISPKEGWQEFAKRNVSFILLAGLGPQVIFALWLASNGHRTTSMYVSLVIARVAFSSSYSGLKIVKGIVRFLGEGRANNSPATILANATLFAASFACIHLNIAQMLPGQYAGLHGWQDAIYFSIVTLATVGYGDIYPVGHLARWASSVEIVCGFIMLVIAVNASLSAWLQTHQTAVEEETEKLTTANQRTEQTASVELPPQGPSDVPVS